MAHQPAVRACLRHVGCTSVRYCLVPQEAVASIASVAQGPLLHRRRSSSAAAPAHITQPRAGIKVVGGRGETAAPVGGMLPRGTVRAPAWAVRDDVSRCDADPARCLCHFCGHGAQPRPCACVSCDRLPRRSRSAGAHGVLARYAHAAALHSCSGVGASGDPGAGGGASAAGSGGQEDGSAGNGLGSEEGYFGSIRLRHNLGAALTELGVTVPSRIQVGAALPRAGRCAPTSCPGAGGWKVTCACRTPSCGTSDWAGGSGTCDSRWGGRRVRGAHRCEHTSPTPAPRRPSRDKHTNPPTPARALQAPARRWRSCCP